MSDCSHMATRVLEHDEQEQLVPALKVLGEPNRLRILCGLGLECRPVTDIIHATGLEQTNVSFHLRVLREAGFVRTERRGPFIYYCLVDSELLRILHALKDWLNIRKPSVEREVNQSSQPVERKVAAGTRR